MKKLLSAIILCIAGISLPAQTPFSTIDSININNINAPVLVHGDMWWNPDSLASYCHYSGIQKSIIGAGGLWMSAYDASGQLHIAAETYRKNDSVDYWPGPLDNSDTLTYANAQTWAKIWKINRGDIQYFQSLSIHTISNTPESILTWPGVGNIHAAGNGGAALTMYAGNTYAPFIDLNGNGIYEPLMGEYPDIPGDQALWWIFSDNGPTHTQTSGKPLGVEVHAMAYGYNRGTLIDNVVYYKYDIINKSANNYSDFRLAQWADMDLGYYYDDFIGFDSVHRMGISYLGTNCAGCTAGGGAADSLASLLFVSAVTMISLPGDIAANYIPAGAFDYFNNDLSEVGNPTADTQYNNYMRAQTRTGEHFTDDFVGACGISKAYGSGPNTNYVYTDDPSDHSGWSECNCCNNPGERQWVLSSNDFTLAPGGNASLVLALIVTDLGYNYGCPSLNFDSIKVVADTAWGNYYNPPPPLPEAVNNILSGGTIDIYPNPVHDILYIKTIVTGYGQSSLTIYNTLGQLMNVSAMFNNHGGTADMSQLPPGMYYLIYNDGKAQKNVRFIKE
jgi:hypothetical protein